MGRLLDGSRRLLRARTTWYLVLYLDKVTLVSCSTVQNLGDWVGGGGRRVEAGRGFRIGGRCDRRWLWRPVPDGLVGGMRRRGTVQYGEYGTDVVGISLTVEQGGTGSVSPTALWHGKSWWLRNVVVCTYRTGPTEAAERHHRSRTGGRSSGDADVIAQAAVRQ